MFMDYFLMLMISLKLDLVRKVPNVKFAEYLATGYPKLFSKLVEDLIDDRMW